MISSFFSCFSGLFFYESHLFSGIIHKVVNSKRRLNLLPFVLLLKAKIYQVMPGCAKMKRIRYAGEIPENRINTVFIRSLRI